MKVFFSKVHAIIDKTGTVNFTRRMFANQKERGAHRRWGTQPYDRRRVRDMIYKPCLRDDVLRYRTKGCLHHGKVLQIFVRLHSSGARTKTIYASAKHCDSRTIVYILCKLPITLGDVRKGHPHPDIDYLASESTSFSLLSIF